MKQQELPVGFGMALAQHPDAMAHFSSLSETEQRAIIDGTRSIQTRQEMQTYVENLKR